MRLFLDCEYNDFKGALISMVLVSEDGREWYEVLPCNNPSDWIAKNVMPILGKAPVSIELMQRSLYAFLAQFDGIHVVADWPEDIVHFCNALIVGSGKRLDTPPLTLEIVRVDYASDLPHNALHDARGIKQAIVGGSGGE